MNNNTSINRKWATNHAFLKQFSCLSRPSIFKEKFVHVLHTYLGLCTDCLYYMMCSCILLCGARKFFLPINLCKWIAVIGQVISVTKYKGLLTMQYMYVNIYMSLLTIAINLYIYPFIFEPCMYCLMAKLQLYEGCGM